MQVSYSPKAVEDIERARQYILGRFCNPGAAMNALRTIFEAGDHLAANPEIGAVLKTDLDLLFGYRRIVAGEYVVIYRVQKDEVRIIRVIHRLQDVVSHLMNE